MDTYSKSRCLLLGAALLTGCVNAVEVTPTVLVGIWGGVHAEVTFTAGGEAVTQYDCAHGAIDAPVTSVPGGRFTATGEHVLEHGGPVREGEPPDAHPARYDGRLTGDRLYLTVTLLDDGTVLGPFELRRDSAGTLVRCL